MKYIILFICFSCSIFAQDASIERNLDSLINTEKAFAEYSKAHGTNEAFLQFLSNESVMFNPYPVNGKELYTSAPEDSSYLFWTPSYAEISSSGDMGFTYGPWIFKPKKDSHDSLAAYGYFLTVWKKENGIFKVAVDGGIRVSSKLDFKRPVKKVYPAQPEGMKPPPSLSLQDADNKLLALSKKADYKTGLEEFTDNETIILKNGSEPFSYKEKPELVKSSKCEWKITKTETSSSGDLGYTIGQGKFSVDGGEFSFFRIWRKGEKGWKIAVDNIRPIKK